MYTLKTHKANGEVAAREDVALCFGVQKQASHSSRCSDGVNTNSAASKENRREETGAKDSSVRISLDEQVQKLPVGQSLITVVQGPGNKALMQVKLPLRRSCSRPTRAPSARP